MSNSIPLKLQAANQKFEQARATLAAFRKQHRALVQEYDLLREAHNAALLEMKEAYRDSYEQVGKRFGEFSVSIRTKLDADRLIELMDDEARPFVRAKYFVDKSAYERGVEEGSIPESVASEVESVQVAVKTPKAL